MARGRGRLKGRTCRARLHGLPVGVESRHSVRVQPLVGQRVPLHGAPCCLGRWCGTVTCQPPTLRLIDVLECWARRNAGDSTDQLRGDIMCVSDGRKEIASGQMRARAPASSGRVAKSHPQHRTVSAVATPFGTWPRAPPWTARAVSTPVTTGDGPAGSGTQPGRPQSRRPSS
eukprot:scaffold117623_cov75-Phaeocystis_antarctica.AAC.3